jgi:hypothetical protein
MRKILLLLLLVPTVAWAQSRPIVPGDVGIQVPFGAVGNVLVAGPATSQVQDSASLSGGVAALPSAMLAQKAPSTPPSSICNTNSYGTAFSCDLSKMNHAIGNNITGATTLGQPASGYVLNPNMSSIYAYFSNASGFNNGTSNNSGRTNGSAIYVKADSLGQGDTTAYFANVFVNSTRAGATSFLANPAGGIIGGQVLAGQAGVYLQPLGDMNCNDQGFDVACIGGVFNLNRSVSTGALGATWLGVRIQSQGSASIDTAFSASGNISVGYDISNATLGTNQAAITMTGNQKIYFNATAGNFFPSSVGSTYMHYSTSNTGLQGVTNGSPVFLFTSGSAFIYGTTQLGVNQNNRLQVAGAASGSPVVITTTGTSDANVNVQITPKGSGTVQLPTAATGTPVASLCLDASNNIIKKTTAGSCI